MTLKTRLLLTATLLTALATMAAAAGPVEVEPATTPFKIGKLKAISVRDAEYIAPNDGSVFGADATTDEVAKVLKEAGAPTDAIRLSVSALVVQIGHRFLLIDTGLGPKAHGVLLQSLAKAGISAGDITDVLITHFHGDHIGGLVAADGQCAFPKAAIRMSAAEWTFMQSQADLGPLVKAITAQVRTFEPGTSVAPGVTAVAIKGHTPGHMGYEIVSGSERLLDIGDSAHSSIISLAKPDWVMGFDSDRALAKTSRMTLLGDLSKSHERIFSPHFPYPGLGTIKSEGDHYQWEPAQLSGP